MARAAAISPIIEMISAKANLTTKSSVTGVKVVLMLIGSILLAISAQYKVPLGPVPIMVAMPPMVAAYATPRSKDV